MNENTEIHEFEKKQRLRYKRPARVMAFIAFVLMAVTALSCAAVIIMGINNGVYGQTPGSFYDSYLCRSLAHSDGRYAVDVYHYNGEIYSAEYSNYLYVIKDENGNILAQNCNGEPAVKISEENIYTYYEYVEYEPDEPAQTADPAQATPSVDNAESTPPPVPQGTELRYEYHVESYIRSPIEIRDNYYWFNQLFNFVYASRFEVIYICIAAAALAIWMLIFLLLGAGHGAGTEAIVLRGQDRIPLDLYLFAVFLIAAFFVNLGVNIMYGNYYAESVISGILAALVVSTVAMATLMTIAARLKAGKWWRNTVIFLWGVRFLRFIGRGIMKFISMLPVTWKLVLSFLGFLAINAILSAVLFLEGSFIAFIALFLVDSVVLVGLCLIAVHMSSLKKGGAKLANGDLSFKLDTSAMLFDLKEHGDNLNSISVGMAKAVEERMKSERLKTELITNVSHDIKTPLTSIISYVDLLKKEHLQNEKAAEYVEVLERQSLRLKKLTEDLVEASKASVGAVSVFAMPIDLSEMLSQAVGEYAERFTAAGIEAIVTAPDGGMIIIADSKLMWRVLDNLFGNICKYSMPGTRAYFSLDADGGRILVMLKNISRETLNISADELTERFVRGDSSRAGEGSGLGLSIAQSLTELQGGSFKLFLDGDLFKVILGFPRA